ncbi:CHASE2 domain-containing protein, partial [Enterococcus faecalis]|uniref:CHASE2 domain-containing protein n=1 Tax=Enterococcus faecalis TaxID=1351 RepID=UPI00403F7225
LVLAVLAIAGVLRHIDPAPLQKTRLIAFDTYQRLEPRKFDPATPVRILDIDEASLAALGQWPWPRSLLADRVDKLEQQGAVAI